MQLQIDEEVKKVLEFMQNNICASKIFNVANSIKELALPLWGHYKREEVRTLCLRHEPLESDDEQPQLAAIE